jgi:hypothetical protein
MGNCGIAKCFFRSVSNNTEGYLAAAEAEYDGMRRASELAQQLQSQCKAKHLYLELAQRVEHVTPDFVNRLNRLIDQPATRVKNESVLEIYEASESVLIVQKVLIAPQPSLFWRGRTELEADLGSNEKLSPSHCRQACLSPPTQAGKEHCPPSAPHGPYALARLSGPCGCAGQLLLH